MREQAAPKSRWFFAVLFELLLEGGKLGKWRIRIRLLIAAVAAGTVRLGVILLAFSPIGTILVLAPRSLTTRPALVATLAALLTVAAGLAVLPVWTPVLAAGLFGRRAGVTGRCCGRSRSSKSSRSSSLSGNGGCRLFRPALPAWTMRTPFGTPGGPPDLDECGLGRRFGCGGSLNRRGGRVRGCRFGIRRRFAGRLLSRLGFGNGRRRFSSHRFGASRFLGQRRERGVRQQG
jgi:hypothetical protein